MRLSKNLIFHYSYIPLLIISIFIYILAVKDLPLFSDSAFHAAIIREILRSEKFPVVSPVGWVAQDMHPMSLQPFLTHPPLFYLLNTNLCLFGLKLVTAMNLTTIIPSVLTIYYFYKLICEFFSKKISLISALFLVFMPMSVWIISHRLMEPLQYMLSLAGFYYLKRYSTSKKFSNLLLGSIFMCSVLYIKITSLFVVVAAFVYLLLTVKNKWCVVTFSVVIALLYLPYTIFSLQTRGSISYAPPGLPVIDKYLFKPWWNWDKNEDEINLDNESNFNLILTKLKTYDFNKRSFIQQDIKNKNLLGLIQKYNIYPVSVDANIHWFSPYNASYGYFLFLYIFGLFLYVKKYINTNYHIILLPLFIFITVYLSAVAELRYFYIINILLTVFYSLSFLNIINSVNNRLVTSIIILATVFFLANVDLSEINHSKSYKNSLVHNIFPEGSGVPELIKFDNTILDKPGNIFTNANSEVSYYLDRTTVWDNRLFFINKNSIDKYLDIYKVSYLVIPQYLLTDTIYNFGEKDLVPNIKQYWQGNSIPTDSDFYKYIQDDSKVSIIYSSPTFTIYKRI